MADATIDLTAEVRRLAALVERFSANGGATGISPALLTTAQAAAYLSISPWTLNRWRKRGQHGIRKCVKKVGDRSRDIRYRRVALDRVVLRLPAK